MMYAGEKCFDSIEFIPTTPSLRWCDPKTAMHAPPGVIVYLRWVRVAIAYAAIAEKVGEVVEQR